jgi:3-methyl-2-oxobutanoate hydroxymethyltransferase
MKVADEKIVALTAYDASFARVLDQAGVDLILVGDSLGQVIQGHGNTLSVTLDHMVYHSRNVTRVVHRALVAADLPFMSYATPQQAAESAARLLGEAEVQMVKLEGGRNRVVVIQHLVDQNIPVCGHLGLLPQSVLRLGGYGVQARDPDSAQLMLEDALILQDAGISMLVLECVPAPLGEEISRALQIPVIGIGAGRGCDGQVLVLHDLLGITPPPLPRFAKDFLADSGSIAAAVEQYVRDVREGVYPAAEHEY